MPAGGLLRRAEGLGPFKSGLSVLMVRSEGAGISDFGAHITIVQMIAMTASTSIWAFNGNAPT